jgi:hypothetical protein
MLNCTSHEVLNTSGDNPPLSKILIQLDEVVSVQFMDKYQSREIDF